MISLKRISYTVAFLVTAIVVSAAENPNVIVLYSDDMGYGDMGCNQGSPVDSMTPCLDRFAEEGMRFTVGHSADGL